MPRAQGCSPASHINARLRAHRQQRRHPSRVQPHARFSPGEQRELSDATDSTGGCSAPQHFRSRCSTPISSCASAGALCADSRACPSEISRLGSLKVISKSRQVLGARAGGAALRAELAPCRGCRAGGAAGLRPLAQLLMEPVRPLEAPTKDTISHTVNRSDKHCPFSLILLNLFF